MCLTDIVGWAIYPAGYLFGYLLDEVNDMYLEMIFNFAKGCSAEVPHLSTTCDGWTRSAGLLTLPAISLVTARRGRRGVLQCELRLADLLNKIGERFMDKCSRALLESQWATKEEALASVVLVVLAWHDSVVSACCSRL